jgi:hypothetical protein
MTTLFVMIMKNVKKTTFFDVVGIGSTSHLPSANTAKLAPALYSLSL